MLRHYSSATSVHVLQIFSHAQRSLPLKVEAVVNNSLNILGSADVSMQTLDLNERMRRFQIIDVDIWRLTFLWEVDVSNFLLRRLNLKCKYQIITWLDYSKLTPDKHRKCCYIWLRGENLRKLSAHDYIVAMQDCQTRANRCSWNSIASQVCVTQEKYELSVARHGVHLFNGRL